MTDAIKLLAIDDKPDNLTTLSAVVRGVLPQTRVLTATNGPAGIELAAAEDPDVILLDIVMPDMDGFEVCRRLKADDRIKDTPVVFLTALNTDTASRVKALEAGAEGFLAKPLEASELAAQIRAMAKVKAAIRSQRTEKARLEALVVERTAELENEHREVLLAQQSAERLSERLKIATRAARIGTWDWNIADDSLIWDDAACEIYGVPSGSLRGGVMEWSEYIHPDDRSRVLSDLQAAMRGEHEYAPDFRIIWADGSIHDIRANSQTFFQNGKPVRMAGINIDLTERKQVENALRIGKDLLSETERIGKLGGWSFNIDTLVQTWTDGVYRIHEVEISPNPSVEAGINYYTKESRPIIEKAVQRAIELGEEYELELEIITAKGNTRAVHTIGKVDSENRRIYGFFQDITDRKRAEEELKGAERQLRSTVDGLSAHIAVVDEYGEVILTNNAYRDFGERNGIEPGTVSEGTNYLAVCDAASGEHSEEAKAFAEGIREVLSGNRQSFELEYPCHSPDEKRWFIGRVTPFAGEGPRRAIVAHENITEQKRAEERRQEGFDLLKRLASLVPGVIYQYRFYPDGRSAFPYSSPGMYDIYEVTPEEVREDATLVFGRLHPEDHERVAEAIFESARTLNTFHCEFRVILPKQGLRWRWSLAHPERTEDGGTLWHGIILDSTERKQLETERQKFFLLAESSSEFIGMCDLDMNPLYVNPAGRRMVGLPDMAAACRVKVADYYFPEDQRFIAEEFFPRVLREGHGDVEIRLRHFQTGEPIWMFYYLFSVSDASGTPVGWATVSRNITERKQADDEIRRLNAELEQRVRERTAQLQVANAELESFSYSVSHDLKAPLRAIDGYSALLEEEGARGLDEDGRRLVREVRANAQQMGRLIEDLLAYSRVGRAALDLDMVDVAAMVEEIVERERQLAPSRRIDLVTDALTPVWADPFLLRQALANVLGNAAKFTRPRDVARIEVSGRRAGGGVELMVRDNGVGFDTRYRHKLFGVFERLHYADEFEGTGVGLAIVKRIVERHGGQVAAESELDRGTVIRMTLPDGPERKGESDV